MPNDDVMPEMTFENMHKAIIEILLHGTKEQQDKVWKQLNEGKGDWVWMKMKILTDMYEAGGVKGREEFTLLAIDRHIRDGNAVQLQYEFYDADSNVRYRQFKFRNGTIHRVPVVTEGMTPETFDHALNKHFLGDYMEIHSSDGTIKQYLLDTEDKLACCNAGCFFRHYDIDGNKRVNRVIRKK